MKQHQTQQESQRSMFIFPKSSLVLILPLFISTQAQICADDPEVAAIRSNFPVPLQIASILQNDSTANSLYQNLLDANNSILNVAPKGSPAGDNNFVGVDYPASDPDCWWSFNKCTDPKLESLSPDVTTCPQRKVWGLTFDDGPVCGDDVLYDFLEQKRLKATLYYIGGNVITYPMQAKGGLEDGHQICGHTWSHKSMTSLTNEQVFAELYYTKLAIKQVLGITIRCWRPPYGDTDDRVRFIANYLGLTATDLWDNDTFDWQIGVAGVTRANITRNYQRIIQSASNTTHGTIVLSHEVNNDTMGEFISQYPAISRAYDHLVPVAVCINQTTPYFEDIVFPTFEEYIDGSSTPNITAEVDPSATLDDLETIEDVSDDVSDDENVDDDNDGDNTQITRSNSTSLSSAESVHQVTHSSGSKNDASIVLGFFAILFFSVFVRS